ncbi:MAG: tRNA (guanine(26)-N(2))-dimethyltransferase [Candidatus Woesearchaeota archaeon]|jgi:tRNA (guanine26-N2/guanine27-N2)-dimethyltransferase|nr:tRNA (guanine(26)-N(2))-dimethyltransferase [Candidatus Woesearchaeota archaeon]
MEIITEGKAKLNIKPEKVVSKQMEVFYNPVMKLNRDTSIILLNALNKKDLRLALPLAGSGIRAIRFLKELNKGIINELYINDLSEKSIKLIKNNLKLNKIKTNDKKTIISNNDANLFLLNSKGFDYIDIDPFGTPNPFLDSAIRRISRTGILAVTATDTSCLCGTFPKAGLRKYWATTKKSPIMHETGIRILIRKIQLVAAQYDKALTPILSYSKDHYFRVFFQVEKGKERVDAILKQHNHLNSTGPMWLGQLWDTKLVNNMIKSIKTEPSEKNPLVDFLKIIKDESSINTVGFYDLHFICKKYKIKEIPKRQKLIKKIKKLNYKASVTHFNPEAIRSNIPLKKLIKLF